MNNLCQKTVPTPRDAHSECNIPAPQGEGPGVGSVTPTPRDRAYTQSTENVILEKHKNNLWLKYPTPAPPLKGRGYAHTPFAHDDAGKRRPLKLHRE